MGGAQEHDDRVGAVLVAGGTGFIGDALVSFLRARGTTVRRGARRAGPDTIRFDTVHCDLDDLESVRRALSGCSAAVYLVHGLKRGVGYEGWEERAAERFARACADAGVRRIVYLGGPDAGPDASPHLRARLRSGQVLRTIGAAHGVEVVELRAAMILGARSDSFRLARDLALRLPALASPAWLDAVQAPVSVGDIVAALAASLDRNAVAPGIYAAPGPEQVGGRALLSRLRALAGLPDAWLPLPALSRGLVGRAAGAFTRVDPHLARELVEGMGRGDLTPREPLIWASLPGHTLTGVDEALARALAEDDPGWRMQLVEGVVRAFARRAWGAP